MKQSCLGSRNQKIRNIGGNKVKNIRIYFSQHHRYFCILLLLIPLKMWFDYLELTVNPRYFTSTAFDHRIPFIGLFVIPYLLWFLFIPFGLIYTGIHSKRDFYKLFLFLFGGMVTANLVFMAFPNAQNLRPAICSGDPFSRLVGFIYSVDTPTDVCPSVHVMGSLAVNAALQHSEAFSKKRYGKRISSVLTVLICLSTVFIKQHSVFDVICGIVVSAFFYVPLYAIPSRETQNG